MQLATDRVVLVGMRSAMMVMLACGCNGSSAAADAGVDAAPPSCPAPVTQDGADHSTVPQMIAAPGAAPGTTILVLGTPDGAGGYASLHGYFSITGWQATKPVNVFLVMGESCTRACSPAVELRAGFHPHVVLLGDNLSGGCNDSGTTPTGNDGSLQLLALPTNDGPSYGYLVQLP